MKSILVPIDGSDSALRAVKLAMSQRQEHKDPIALHLLTVQLPILSGNVTRFFSAEALQEYYEAEGNNALLSAKTILDTNNIPYTEKLMVGPIAPTIAKYAKETECDHIIMGTRGLGSISGFVLGSVATKVLHLVDIPVTLVK